MPTSTPTTTQPTLSPEVAGAPRKHFVCVAGNIGVGKTTVTTLVESILGFKKYEESVEGNPYLPLFYTDMPTWSYKLQRYFLMTRFVAHENIVMAAHSVVQDRSIYEDMEVFAELQVRLGHFTPEQAERYRAFCRLMYGEVAPPDLLVFLRAPLPVLRERIARRHREYELDLLKPGNRYLEHLQELYDRWIDAYALGRKIIVDTERFNFVEDHAHVEALMERIRSALVTAPVTPDASHHFITRTPVCSSATS